MEETNMKRSIILGLLGLLLDILPAVGASYTNSTEHLVLGKMWMEGGCRAYPASACGGDKQRLG